MPPRGLEGFFAIFAIFPPFKKKLLFLPLLSLSLFLSEYIHAYLSNNLFPSLASLALQAVSSVPAAQDLWLKREPCLEALAHHAAVLLARKGR